MASTFTVHEASGYEQLMGRWSRRLAPAFVEFAGLAAGEKLLAVGCGTGSLTFELAARGEPIEIRAIDYAPAFVEAARQRNTDPRVTIEQADATALPFGDRTFDRAMAMLVLHLCRTRRWPSEKCVGSSGQAASLRRSYGTILVACPGCA
jgi:ubiquinone/menaquinone biosynthesis C-methylase UbiE